MEKKYQLSDWKEKLAPEDYQQVVYSLWNGSTQNGYGTDELLDHYTFYPGPGDMLQEINNVTNELKNETTKGS